jgi:hypothetical protein
MRMAMRRMTRLTSGFGTPGENCEHATSLYFRYENVARIPSTLPVTPAMEAGMSRHRWAIADIFGLLEACALQIAPGPTSVVA